MASVIEKLVEISSEPLHPRLSCFEGDGAFAMLVPLLERKNGFFAFESALHVFPTETTALSWGLTEWNRSSLWKCEYKGIVDKVFCFAEDLFGNQFCIENDEIVTLDVETGQIRHLASTLEEWIGLLLVDYGVLTGYPLAHAWQQRFGPLPPRERLMPKMPFIFGGEYDVANLASVDGVKLMRNMGSIACQVYDVPDGGKVRLKLLGNEQ